MVAIGGLRVDRGWGNILLGSTNVFILLLNLPTVLIGESEGPRGWSGVSKTSSSESWKWRVKKECSAAGMEVVLMPPLFRFNAI